MEIYIAIKTHDPIIARDGRPFDLGQRMKSLDWPYPSVLAGSMRTMLGKMNGGFSDRVIEKLLNIEIVGPLPMKEMQLYLPIPKDIVARKTGAKIVAVPVRPATMRKDERCDLPNDNLRPAMLSESTPGFKSEKMPAFWSIGKMIEWLTNPKGSDFQLYKNSNVNRNEKEICLKCGKDDPDFLDAPEKDKRIHTGIERNRGTAEDGMLFMSIGLDLASNCQGREVLLSARVRLDEDVVFAQEVSKLNEIHPFGGERRLAQWSRTEEPVGWNCPNEISSKFTEIGTCKIRMVLASPAIFSNGWLPGWLDPKTLEGIPPEAKDDQKLRLISACLDRWKPISGWSAEAKSRGPKAIRRMVPAGAVYFFKAQNAKAASDLAKSHWLESVCDGPQDRKDGFGLAVWGIWEEADRVNKTNEDRN